VGRNILIDTFKLELEEGSFVDEIFNIKKYLNIHC